MFKISWKKYSEMILIKIEFEMALKCNWIKLYKKTKILNFIQNYLL